MIKILLTSDLHLGLGLVNENTPIPDSSRYNTLDLFKSYIDNLNEKFNVYLAHDFYIYFLQ